MIFVVAAYRHIISKIINLQEPTKFIMKESEQSCERNERNYASWNNVDKKCSFSWLSSYL